MAMTVEGQVVMSVVGEINPSNTIVSAKLASDPKGEVTYLPSSSDSFILFSTCGLTFNSSNYNIPQQITLRRKTFTPLKSGSLLRSSIPPQNFDLILSETGSIKFYTFHLQWIPKPSKIVSFWGDPHFDNVINDAQTNGQGTFNEPAVTHMQLFKYFSVLKSKSDWEVLMYTEPWGKTTAAVHSRLCVRNVNNVICVNKNGTLSFLNPLSQDKYPIDVVKVGNEYQFLLPSGSTIETVPNSNHLTSRISIQPVDLGGLSGIGNITLINSVTDAARRKAFVNQYELPASIHTMLNAANMTNALQFSPSALATQLSYSACIPGVSMRSSRVVIINQTSTVSETIYQTLTSRTTEIARAAINATATSTNWAAVTENTVIVQGTTKTNNLTASTTVTDTIKAHITSEVVVGSTVVVGGNATVSSVVTAVSVNVVGKTVTYEQGVTITRNYSTQVTDTVKQTEVVLHTETNTEVETLYLTDFVRGDDVIEVLTNKVTDTIRSTVLNKATSTKNVNVLTTIEEHQVSDVTNVVSTTENVEVHYNITDTFHETQTVDQTNIEYVTDTEIENVTKTNVIVDKVTNTITQTSKTSTTTNVYTQSTSVKEEEVIEKLTSTKVVAATQVLTARRTNLVIDQVNVTETSAIVKTSTIDATISHTVTDIETRSQTLTETKTISSTIEEHSTSTSTVTVHEQTIVTANRTVSEEGAVVFETVYTPLVVFVTTNQTDGTSTLTETIMFTETSTLTNFADPVLTTVTAAS